MCRGRLNDLRNVKKKDAHYCGALALLAQGHYEQGELEKAISAYTEALREILAHFGEE